MNTQQLESFVQVAENLSFARAAEALNITQSAVSRQIRALEEELGTKLLHRSTRSVALTPAGISFLNDAKEVLLKLQMSAQKMKNHSSANIQILSIGCLNEAYLSFLTPLLRKCKEQFPEIHPFFHAIPFRAAVTFFIHDEFDLLFGFEDDIPAQSGLHYAELTKVPVCFALHSEHPLAKRESLSEQDMPEDNLIICNSYEIPAQSANIQTQLSQKFSPDRTNYCVSLQTLLTLIRSGYGFGILPEIPSSDTDIIYIPMQPECSLSYGIFYKDTAQNPVA